MEADRAAVRHIVQWMDQITWSRRPLDGWVVGVSGGIDSAVTSALAAQTGSRPTAVLRMPIHQARLTRTKGGPTTWPGWNARA